MKKQAPTTPPKTHPFLESYRRNFLSFIEVLLSVLPVVVLAICGISLGVFIFSEKIKYLVLFLTTLIGAPLLQTISEHLEKFFERQTRN